MLRRILRIVLVVIAAVLALAAVAALSVLLMVRGSLPRTDGERRLDGLDAAVTVTRDALGVPDVTAGSRLDAARALGWLHGQDRFFQMDLMRRAAAGELAALLGPALVDADRDARRHRFRARAAGVLARLDARETALLEAYAEGVNAGLGDLRARPWEYWALRRQPEPWRPEDSVLVLDSMFMDLALDGARTEAAWAAVHDRLPAGLAALLLPRSNRWEAPLQDDPLPVPALPDSTAVDIRTWNYGGRTWASFLESDAPADTTGSNNWAVAGRLTRHGGALLATDMHLGLGLPNTWYRARLSWPESDGLRSLVGATLPGTPALVAGSNGDVAWGFTNSYGDWIDLVIVETDSLDADRYRTPDGWRTVERVPEIITVAGAASDTLVVEQTVWGPLWDVDAQGRPRALRWTAHDVEAVDFHLLQLETAGSVDEAVAAAGGCGIPPQNMVCCDIDGRIAWAIAGRIPRRVGWDGRLPVSWADGACRWDGYLDPAEQPRLVDPAEGRLWTANARVVGGSDLAVIGDGGYALGARARQIRDGLRALDHPDERDMLALQLDDRALFMNEWRLLFVATLERHADRLTPDQTAFLAWARDRWGDGRATPGSVAYFLVRNSVWEAVDEVYDTLAGPLRAREPDFRMGYLPYRHEVLRRLLDERPPHLLPPGHRDWDSVLLGAAGRAVDAARSMAGSLEDFTWGSFNRVKVAHPFTQIEPRLARWLAAPAQAMPGDSFMPRVQGRISGASERMVVSPGREEQGLFHMPGGQSGHPLSRWFLAGHDDWTEGRPTPLLPGAPAHTLTLEPR
jgi:penicillin amidase